MRDLIRYMVVVTFGCSLSACGGGGGDGQGICHSMSAANAVVTSSAGSSINNLAAAADGDFNSAATITIIGSGSASIRATAQSGIAFPNGQTVGVYWSNRSGSTYNLTLNTYLGGVLQESLAICGACGTNNPGPARYDGQETSRSFDAVEVMLSGSQSNTQPATFDVHELCDR